MNIDIKNLTITFPSGKTLFNGASFNLKGPGLYFLLGPNGSGKSTVARLLAGKSLEAQIDGELFIQDKLQASVNMPSQYSAYVDQETERMIAPHFTGQENMALAQLPHFPDLTLFKTTNKSLLDIPMDIPVKDLSGGQRQLLAITMALMKKPKIVICDEPTSALDTQNAILVMDMLYEVSKDILCICISHDTELIKRYKDAQLIRL